ncbi:hypothetical protein B5M09_010656 [Aphanomyces astaci]|uniref:Uncharacterized protein n=1 Tax=Aphanomyces astaci TaxID=112090 RepID=A0A425CTF6_APHAT|nr:hypothetical protein B5M09_010656 [Aphanomyces astaci]
MGKGIKWTTNEDNQLARSWVCTSEDPIKGADQTTDSFWANWRVLPPSKKLAQLAESFDASDEVGDGDPTRPVGCKKAKRKALEETSVDLKLQDLVRVQEDKN